MKKFIVLFFLILRSAYADVVYDPLKDFLNLPIPGRYTDVSEVVVVYEVRCDIDGDGSNELFIGHQQMWNGGNGIYFTAYKPVPDGFLRLLPPNKDVVIDFYGGDRACIYVGWVSEKKSQGMLILDPVYQRVPGDPSKLLPVEQYSARKFYRIKGGKLLIEELGPLDLRTKEGKAFYDRYFGTEIKSRSLRFEHYSAGDLEGMGYKLPDWKQLPESGLHQ